MPIKRRRQVERREPLAPGLVRWLETGVRHNADSDDEDRLTVYRVIHRCHRDPEQGRRLWQDARDAILPDWIARYPGTRPAAWWTHDAPEPWLRLGGVGTPAHGVLANAPRLRFGIPMDYVTREDVEYYTGHAVDVHGRPIGQEYTGRAFAGVAIDPDDPPVFESQAAYLDRLGLLGAAERLALAEDAFEPALVHSYDVGLDEEETP